MIGKPRTYLNALLPVKTIFATATLFRHVNVNDVVLLVTQQRLNSYPKLIRFFIKCILVFPVASLCSSRFQVISTHLWLVRESSLIYLHLHSISRVPVISEDFNEASWHIA